MNFDDSDDDKLDESYKPQKRGKTEAVKTQPKAAQKKKSMFDDDDSEEIDFKPPPPKPAQEKPVQKA